MRKGKDQTYRLPILVAAGNSYIEGTYDLIDAKKAGFTFHEWGRSDYYFIKFTYGYFKQQKFSNQIPRASYYRVIEKLSKDGYLQKIIPPNNKMPEIVITLKGLIYLIETFI